MENGGSNGVRPDRGTGRTKYTLAAIDVDGLVPQARQHTGMRHLNLVPRPLTWRQSVAQRPVHIECEIAHGVPCKYGRDGTSLMRDQTGRDTGSSSGQRLPFAGSSSAADRVSGGPLTTLGGGRWDERQSPRMTATAGIERTLEHLAFLFEHPALQLDLPRARRMCHEWQWNRQCPGTRRCCPGCDTRQACGSVVVARQDTSTSGRSCCCGDHARGWHHRSAQAGVSRGCGSRPP